MANPEKLRALRAREASAKQKKGRRTEERHHAWKGDNATYVAVHVHIARVKGRPSKCERCGTESAKKYEWANVDHRYSRNPDDYVRMCTSCHRNYDYVNGLSLPRQPRAVAFSG